MIELLRRVQRPYDIPLNIAIWIAFKPMIKIYLSIGAGFLLTKLRILTTELSKGISRLLLIIFMPCLIFNNIVSQIKDTDIKLFGVVIFTGFLYYVIGLGWGILVWCVSPIPRAWVGGLLLCCMLNNCSDLPLAYVQTIGKTPILPADAAAKGESYSVLMVIIFVIFNFNLGGTRLIEWDATQNDPHRSEPTVPVISWKAFKRLVNCHILRKKGGNVEEERKSHNSTETKEDDTSNYDLEAQTSVFTDHEEHIPFNESHQQALMNMTDIQRAARYSYAHNERPFGSTEVYYSRRRGSGLSETTQPFEDARSTITVDCDAPMGFQNLARHMTRSYEQASSKPSEKPVKISKFKVQWQNFKARWFRFKAKNGFTTYICNFVEDIFLPQMLALIAGITVAMIPWVRNVFVKGQYIKNFHDAPDQNPPLDFLMDFSSFFAGAQVPLGLMLLGGTIASLQVGKMVKGFWKTAVLIIVFKLGILPIIACAWIHRMRAIGWLDLNDAMTPIVLAVGSGTPSATVQIYLTLAWIDPNQESVELNCLAIALLTQYAILPISMTILMTYVVMHYV